MRRGGANVRRCVLHAVDGRVGRFDGEFGRIAECAAEVGDLTAVVEHVGGNAHKFGAVCQKPFVGCDVGTPFEYVSAHFRQGFVAEETASENVGRRASCEKFVGNLFESVRRRKSPRSSWRWQAP